ncbi:MAG TPA: M13 family metallopeptidase [Chitinophagaceae bacterium]|nr:M13 family metallopeptidase [Chitinophagaceae bacterium]
MNFSKWLFASGIVLLASCAGNNGSTKKDILAANLDTTVNPANDFFDYANGGWIKANPIPGDQSSWGIGGLVIEENRNRLKAIAEKAANANAAEGTTEQKIGDFWNVAMDSAKIEKDGITPLQPYLNMINAVTDKASLQKTFGEFDIIGVGGPISMYVSQDDKNSAQYALEMWQTGIGLPEREYYFKQDSSTVEIRHAYVKYITTLLTMIGEDTAKAATAAKNILAMETQMAKSFRKREDLRDPYANYNKFAVKDLGKVSPDIDWTGFMNIIGASRVDSVIIGQPETYKENGVLIKTIPLDTWKDYLRFNLVDAFTGALPDTFGRASFAYNQSFSGAKERKPRWKRVISTEERAMGELLGKLYVQDYFDSTAKKRYSDLVENIRTALKNRIEKLTWMSDSTKQKAYAKLAAVTKKVGYPDKWKDFSALKIGKESFVQNLINTNIFWHNYNINKLGKPVDKDEWDMYPQTYNAYYNPSNNEIVLPAGIFTVPGYKDDELDDAIVYGYAAASTIGHELTHGFDDEGRQYDAEGNLKPWWTKDDSAKFQQRANMLADQFSQYVPVDTLHLNGKISLGENIADLGGVLLGWDAFKLTDEYKENKPIAGLSPAKRYFLGYALGWLDESTDKAMRSQVLQDVHAPAKYRVNGPFSDVDAFYETFDVKPGNKMYRPDSLRVRIW